MNKTICFSSEKRGREPVINLLISPKKKGKKNLLVSLNWMITAFNRVGPLSGFFVSSHTKNPSNSFQSFTAKNAFLMYEESNNGNPEAFFLITNLPTRSFP